MPSFKSAYGAGWRAGMSERELQHHANGTKTLSTPANPFILKRHFIHRLLWEQGYYNGTMESLNRWLEKRRAV